MRLLNARTYELQTFLSTSAPAYAILSHTWEDGEVLFEHMRDTSKIEWSAKKGYFKIKKTCDQALKDGCDFVWIDTCNINKDSSSELSEAINSMFRWYRDATICYAYISDIKAGDGWSFSKCRWLTRGWTLQEMIAPDRVHFYDRDWTFLGSRISLANELSETSGIHESVLLRRYYTIMYDRDGNRHLGTPSNDCQCCINNDKVAAGSMLDRFSVAQRMNWASKRTTTREEDVAYCLMGLFNVNMPLLYGEGTKAFLRLQKAILETRIDHSILAFRASWFHRHYSESLNFLPRNPNEFHDDIQHLHEPALGRHLSLHGTTLSIDMLICPVKATNAPRDVFLGILDCSMNGDPHMRPAILLSALNKDRMTFRCIFWKGNLFSLHSSYPGEAKIMSDPELGFDSVALQYEPADIKRVRISIIGEDTVIQVRHETREFVKFDISSIFGDLGYQTTSLLPLATEPLLETASQSGSITFFHEQGERFSIDWNTWNAGTPSKFRCGVSSFWNPENKAVIERYTDLDIDRDLESIGRPLIAPHTDLGESSKILLAGPGTTSFEVWISMSKKIFIGRSRLVLSVHGKTVGPESDKEAKPGLISWLLGR